MKALKNRQTGTIAVIVKKTPASKWSKEMRDKQEPKWASNNFLDPKYKLAKQNMDNDKFVAELKAKQKLNK